MASVFAQEYKPVEIVVVDDGSTDNTTELMDSYGDKVRYYWQENQGVAVTRTNACRLARGEYIAFQDDDDLMPLDRIVVLYEALRQHQSAVMAIGDWAAIDSDGNLTGTRWLPKDSSIDEQPILIRDGYEAVLWPKVPAAPHTTLFRRADGHKIGWFDHQYRNASEDKDFFARLGRLGSIVYVPKVVSYYRLGHTSLTSNGIAGACSKVLLFEKHLNLLESKQKKLRKRLQFRMLTSLKMMSPYKSKGMKLSDWVFNDYIKRGLSLLGFRDRLAYRWSTLIKFPICGLMRKYDLEFDIIYRLRSRINSMWIKVRKSVTKK